MSSRPKEFIRVGSDGFPTVTGETVLMALVPAYWQSVELFLNLGGTAGLPVLSLTLRAFLFTEKAQKEKKDRL